MLLNYSRFPIGRFGLATYTTLSGYGGTVARVGAKTTSTKFRVEFWQGLCIICVSILIHVILVHVSYIYGGPYHVILD